MNQWESGMNARSDKSPYVVFVILNWNQGEMTAECLATLRAQTYVNYDVVVIDNGSSDGSQKMLSARFQDITLVENRMNLGYSEGNNMGIKHALDHGADYVLLLNNDTAVDPEMLSILVESAESDPQIGMVGPTMYYYDQPKIIAAAGSRIDWRRGDCHNLRDGEIEPNPSGPLQEVDFIVSCAVLVKRSVIEQIGLLDPRYFINWDDTDWAWRVKKAGYRVIYVPEAKMYHKVSAAMGVASPAAVYYTNRNQLLFFASHNQGFTKILALAIVTYRIIHTISAWTLRSKYRSLNRHRLASLLALRDAILGHYGKMGTDVAKVCYGQ